MRVLAYTITRADTPERAKLLNATLTLGRQTAGMPFDWHVYVNGEDTIGKHIVDAAQATGVVTTYEVSPVNVGQHPHINAAHKRALEVGYDAVVRIDDDVEWQTKRWLARLVEASERLGYRFILSPVVRGLRWQPPQSDKKEIEGVPIKFIYGPIGGICRFMTTEMLREKPYVSDVRMPMGGGDAVALGDWARQEEPISFLAYCQHIRVRHGKSTDEQEAADPGHFDRHSLYQHVPYIPVWP